MRFPSIFSRVLSVIALAAAVLVAAAMPTPALAQSDWQVQRDPFDRRVVARYKQILARTPSDRGALRKLMGLYRRYRSLDQLTGEYERVLASHPDDVAAIMVLGHIALERGNQDQALSYYERAARLRPQDAGVQVALGDIHRQAGRTAEAGAAYEQALGTASLPKPLETQIVQALAELALAQGDMDRARAHYERYFALAPRDVQARIALGDALVQHGQAQAGIEVLRAAEERLRTDPARQVEVMARIGAALEAAGQEGKAVQTYRQAMARVGRTYYLRKELTARIVDIHRRQQTLPALITRCENDWPEPRRDHFEWDLLARLYEETGNQEKAIAAFRKATRKAPYELDTQRRLIALLENAGREQEALAQYEAVIRVAPGEPRFQLELAERYWRHGDEKRATALLARIERRFPGDGGVHAAIADLYTRWGKPDRALAAYVRLTRIEPGDMSHVINLGEQHFQRGDKKQAMAVWKRLLAGKAPAGYARLGEVYAQHDMLVDALAMYDKAIQLEPKQPEHYKGRAAVHERRREFLDAVGDWQTAFALLPRTPAGKPARAEARRRVVSLLKRARGTHLRRRIDAWRRAFYGNTPDAEAGYFLVEAYLREQRHASARRVLERLLAMDADDTEAMEQLVKVYERERKYDQAVTMLERLAELVPARRREYYDRIAEIKTADRKDEEAILYAQKALEQSPGDPVAYQRLAERYAEMQRFDRAIAAYEKAVELDPRNVEASFALAQLYVHGNTPGKAAALYRQILRQATDEQILARAGREAIDLEEMTQTLGELERELAPLSFTYAHKPVYRRILVELYHRYVPGLARAWRKGSAEERRAARAELDRLGAHGLKPLLEALNDDTDPQQQRIAVSVLGYLGNKGAAAPLVRLAMKAPAAAGTARSRLGALMPRLEWNTQLEALVAAGRLADERIIDDLVALSRNTEPTMREAALFALGRTGHRKAMSALLAALDLPGASEQILSCLGLAQLGQLGRSDMGRVAARLVDVVASRDRDDDARAACAFALGYLAMPAAVDALVSVLDEGNGDLQRLAAWALGRIGDASAMPALLGAYFSRHPEVRPAVHAALATLGAGKPAPIPDIAFDDYPVRQNRYDTSAVLQRLPGALATPPLPPTVIAGNEAMIAAGLREALGRHRDVLVSVLSDLNQGSGHLALGPLTAGLETAPAQERARLGRALDRIGQGILARLADLTGHRDPVVRRLSLSVIAKIDTAEAPALLRTGMEDPVPSVRLTAMQAAANHVRLFGHGGPVLVRAVVAQLGSESWRTRADAARALGDFGAQGDAAALARAAGDHNAYVREQAILALGRQVRVRGGSGSGTGDPATGQIVSALIEATKDELAVIRLAAVQGLEATAAPRARARLRQLAASDPDEEVVRSARHILEKTRD